MKSEKANVAADTHVLVARCLPVGLALGEAGQACFDFL